MAAETVMDRAEQGTVRLDRPRFFADPATDTTVAMMVNLLGEVAVLRDRLDMMERLLAAQGTVTAEMRSAWTPDKQAEEERAAARAALIERVLRPVERQLDEQTRGGGA